MSSSVVRVRVLAPAAVARKLCARLTRGGIPAAPDDGQAAAEILVAFAPGDLAPLRARAVRLLVVGTPGPSLFAAGADDVVEDGEPEKLFRRVRLELERLDLAARAERQAQRIAALETALADAAHDVRSPLQGVIGNAELLARDPTLGAEQRKCAEAAMRQAFRALERAERILESAGRRENVTVRPGPLDLGQLVTAAAAQADAHARAKKVSVKASAPSPAIDMRGDEELLARLLDNLLANAVKHSAPGSTVEVSASRSGPRTVRLVVQDTGPGVAPAELARLVAGLGSGRGLRIVRDIAEAHGGELLAQSEPGKGARFMAELPLQASGGKPRVLLVSDDAGWVKTIAETLREACEVTSAGLTEAVIKRGSAELVLVEAGALAERGAAQKLEALRSAAQLAQVPLVELPAGVAAGKLARMLAGLAR